MKDRRGRNPVNCVASIDTIELFFPGFFLPSGIRTALEKVHQRRIRVNLCKTRNGYILGQRLIIHGPISQATIKEFNRWQERYKGIVCRFDIAFDFPIEELDFILTHALLKHRRKGPMLKLRDAYDNQTNYWIDQEGRRAPNRNLVLYCRSSKITGKRVAHLELRFQRTQAVRSQNIHQVKDLLNLNPKAVLDRCIKWSNAGDKFAQKVIRRAVKEQKYLNNESYQKNIVKKVRSILRKTEQNIAQNRKNFDGKRDELVSNPAFFIVQDKLEWEQSSTKGGAEIIREFKKRGAERVIIIHALEDK